jgi:heme-degrading monooxygenase HmoA
LFDIEGGIVITRVWECGVVPATAAELIRWIDVNSWPKVAAVPGFLGGTLYTPLSSNDKIITVSHWDGTEAISAYVGANWLDTPVVYDEERPYLTGEPTLAHYVRRQAIHPAGGSLRTNLRP